jgi:hypothetical protein
MLFAAFPSPTGYAPPPRRNTNPLLIVLGVCGGCALIGVIALVIIGVVSFKQPFTQRIVATGQFMAAIKTHNYTAAETQLAGEARTNYPASKLQQIEDGLEQKYGPLENFLQAGVDMSDQHNPNSLSQISYNLRYQNGKSTITLNFNGDGQQTGKITGLEWDTKGSSSGGNGDSSGSGDDEKPKKKHGAPKGGANSGSDN